MNELTPLASSDRPRVTISFDVFDTVVTRAFAHPRDLFVHLGTILQELGVSALAPLDFARARWAAELAAHQQSLHKATSLDEIYRRLAMRIGWTETSATAARTIELELEARFLRAVPLLAESLAAARAEAGRIVFLSDMYLPTALLRGWLDRLNVTKPGDILLISGEAGGGKSSGALFHVARDVVGGEFMRWRHLGDHSVADVGKPRQLGITATYFPSAHLTPRERSARHVTGEFAPAWRSLLGGAMRLARLERAFPTERERVLWEIGTGVAGPLFYGFVRWTLTEARRRGLQRLYFLARDGQVFWQIAQKLESAEPTPIECRYLHASRLVFSGPAELHAPRLLAELVAPGGHFHSLRQALAIMGLDETWAIGRLPVELGSLAFDKNLEFDERRALAEWLLMPERSEAIRLAIGQRTEIARAYLQAEGVRAGEPIGLVDAGWAGTIQRNLEFMLGDGHTPTPLTGFYLGLKQEPDLPCRGEAHGYTNRFAPLPFRREESHRVLIELLAQADHGQVIGFAEQDGRWVPRLNDAGPVDFTLVRLLHEAALTFTNRAVDTGAEAPVAADEFARAVIGLYRDFHDHPTEPEVRVFGFLPHADQWLEQRHGTLCANFTSGEILRALRDHHRRPPHWWIAGQAALGHPWPLRGFAILKTLWWRLKKRSA